MKQLIALCLILACLAVAHARTPQPVPGSVVLRDDYDRFTATFVSKSHGKFDVSIGESHEGEPGFQGNEKGSETHYSIVIYHMEPGRKPLLYVATHVDVAKGQQDVSVTPLFRGTNSVSYKA
jgi:hypothetical protein